MRATPSPKLESNLKNVLILDLSAIGISTTPNTFALRVSNTGSEPAGVFAGDVLIVEERKPKAGELVASYNEESVSLVRVCDETRGVAAIVAGLIRRLKYAGSHRSLRTFAPARAFRIRIEQGHSLARILRQEQSMKPREAGAGSSSNTSGVTRSAFA